jgi:hypothetical protein
MTETNTAAQANGTTTHESIPAKLYATRAECEAAKPADASKALKPFEVLQNGTSRGWVLARGHAIAIEQVARLDGYTATTGKAIAPITKEQVNAKVMEMSDDEFKALVAARKAAKK